MSGYTYTTTDGKTYQVEFGEYTGQCKAYEITISYWNPYEHLTQ